MRVLVATVVHEPRDARVYAREIGALLEAGHEVTYIAPFSSFEVDPPDEVEGLTVVDIPAAQGRRRLPALRAARRQLRQLAGAHDVVLLHCPELLLVAWDLRHPCIVWDVHEDTAAAVTMKAWLPRPIRPAVARSVRFAEGWAERHWHLLLAEESYATRFNRRHPIVPNSTPIPEEVPLSGRDRVVYVGHVTKARGGEALIEMARLLVGQMSVHLIGHADEEMTPLLLDAVDRGEVIWHGYLPNAQALTVVQGATAGLSLLRDEPNYRHSRPTKIMEYLAQGVPVISTPLPLARQMLEDSGGGVLVPFDDPQAAAHAAQSLAADDDRRAAMAASGRRWVAEHADWNVDGPTFVAVLEQWAATDRGEERASDTA